MDRDAYQNFLEVLHSLDPNRQEVFLKTMQLIMECCKNDSDLSAVLVVKRYSFSDYTMNITALRADQDDAYEMLFMACTQVAEAIKQEAPDRAQYN